MKIRCVAFAALLLTSCSTASTTPPAPVAEAGLCPETVAEYCANVGGCQLTWASALADCTAISQLSSCGGLDQASVGPHHDYYDHASGALVVIIQTGGACLAGPADYQPSMCAMATPIACPNVVDAGTITDGGDG